MKRFMLTFSICLWTVISLFSQNSYPKKIVIESDTVVAINESQLKQINARIINEDNLKSYNDSLNLLIKYKNDLLKLNKIALDSTYLEMRREYSEVCRLRDLNKVNDDLIKYYEEEIKYNKRRRFRVGVAGFTIGVATTSILYLIFK